MRVAAPKRKAPGRSIKRVQGLRELRGEDLNLRPSGYEPDELPDCSTPLHAEARLIAVEHREVNGIRPDEQPRRRSHLADRSQFDDADHFSS